MKTTINPRTRLLTDLQSLLEFHGRRCEAYDNCLSDLISLSECVQDADQPLAGFLDHRATLRQVSRCNSIDQYRNSLVEAEHRRLHGENYAAIEHYDKSIELAKSKGYLEHAAVIAELAACLFIDWDKENHAVPYIHDAYQHYEQAGKRESAQLLFTCYESSLALLNQLAASQVTTGKKTTSPIAKDQQTDNQINYKRLVEEAVDVIWSVDLQGFFTYLSPQWQSLFGFKLTSSLATSTADYIHPDDWQHVNESVHNLYKGKQPRNIEFRHLCTNNTYLWVMVKATVIFDSHNRATGIQGILRDITEKKQAELALQKANDQFAKANKLKDAFLANMSHELRTPLTAIMATNEALQTGMLGPCNSEQVECLAVIHESSNHLLDLINEVIDLSKIEAGSVELNVTDINIKHLCQSCLKLVSSQAAEKTIRLHLQIPIEINRLKADEKRLRQMLVNLLHNAIKFSAVGDKVTLSVVQCIFTEPAKNRIRFSVIDRGIGIEKSQLDSLFEPFQQVQTALNRSYNGMGLGLALVKKFTELHSGSVGVNSKPGDGSCFYVDLPISNTSSTRTVQEQPPSSIARKQRASSLINSEPAEVPFILLAEDNNSVAQAITRHLEFFGYRVSRATDGASAVQLAASTTPDVILMDIQMPRVDGLAAIQQIRNIPTLRKTPIIALTGMASEKDERRCIDAGADHYLCKPYRMKLLIDLVEHLTNTPADLAIPELL